MSKQLLLHSGGLDSTMLAGVLKKQGSHFESLFIDFGHNAAQPELAAVRNSSSLLQIAFDVIDASGIRQAFVSSNHSVLRIVPNPGVGVLPLGSLLVFGVALPYALQNGFHKILIGYTKDDADFSREYASEFLKTCSLLSEIAGRHPISIEAPFLSNTKAALLREAAPDTQLLRATWSCVLGGATPCGQCDGCRSRTAALGDADRNDG